MLSEQEMVKKPLEEGKEMWSSVREREKCRHCSSKEQPMERERGRKQHGACRSYKFSSLGSMKAKSKREQAAGVKVK
jgi:hypothetical protein